MIPPDHLSKTLRCLDSIFKCVNVHRPCLIITYMRWQYPTHKQRAARNLERPETRTKDRPKPSSVETSIRVPIVEPNDMGSAHGEPLVHDFQTHYMTGPSKAPELNTQSPSVSGSNSPTSPTFFNEPAHYGAPPPPDVTRRDIHIPIRTR